MAEQQRGFAGFDSLVSDLSDLPAPPSPEPEAKAVPRLVAAADDRLDPVPQPKPNKKGFPKWIAIAAIIGGLIVIGVINSDKQNGSVSWSTSPTNTSRAATATPPATVESPVARQNSSAEEKPPIAEGTILSSAQLRYCLAQRIRIDGAQQAVDDTSQTEIKFFNALVDDYNARCPKARYHTSTMSTVKPEVEARRAQLETEGAALIRSSYSR